MVAQINSGKGEVNVEPLTYHNSVSVILPGGGAKGPCIPARRLRQWLGCVHDKGKRTAVHAGDVAGRSSSVHARVKVHDGYGRLTKIFAYSATESANDLISNAVGAVGPKSDIDSPAWF